MDTYIYYYYIKSTLLLVNLFVGSFVPSFLCQTSNSHPASQSSQSSTTASPLAPCTAPHLYIQIMIT